MRDASRERAGHSEPVFSWTGGASESTGDGPVRRTVRHGRHDGRHDDWDADRHGEYSTDGWVALCCEGRDALFCSD